MRLFITFSIVVLVQFCFGSCASGIDRPFPEANHGENKSSIKLASRIPLSSTKSLSFNFGFTSDNRLWNTVNWGEKDNQFSFSDDLGKTWTPVDVPLSVGTDSTIMFIDAMHGWATAGSKILGTKDGGKSWLQIPLPDGSNINEIKGITFTNNEQGFIAGSASRKIDRGSAEETHSMEILCTNDAGNDWSVCFQTNDFDLIYKIVSSENAVVGVLWETGILRSQNHGATWERKNLDFKIRDITTDTEGKFWAIDHGPLIRHSNDSGNTWEISRIENVDSGKLRWNSLTFGPDGRGVIVGDQGEIALTFDRGDTWKLVEGLSIRENLWTVRMQNSYVAILGEKHLYVLRFE